MEDAMTVTDRARIMDSMAAAIVNRIDSSNLEESLQAGLDGVLAGLADNIMADLYARIVTQVAGCASPTLHVTKIVKHELSKTNLWGAV